jgi:sugar lactone lactonase YvrE
MTCWPYSLLFLGVLLPAAAFAAEEQPPQYQDSWNSCDSDPCYPIGLAADSGGNLHVLDLSNNHVTKFGPDGSVVNQWGIEGTDPGQLSGAQGLAIDGSGNFFVTDTGNNRVQKFSSSGSHLATWGGPGTGNVEFDTPGDVDVGPSGNVYVVDRGNHRIQKLSGSGAYVTEWGGQGSGTTQLDIPRGIAVDGTGKVYVADSRNNRVVRYNSDGTSATVFVPPGVNQGQVVDPSRIDVDGSGNVFVVDRGSCDKACRVQKFSSSGTFLTAWGSDAFGCQGTDCNGKFLHALDVAVSDMGSIWVSDFYPIDLVQGRIQRFSFNVPALPTTWGRLKSLYP